MKTEIIMHHVLSLLELGNKSTTIMEYLCIYTTEFYQLKRVWKPFINQTSTFSPFLVFLD